MKYFCSIFIIIFLTFLAIKTSKAAGDYESCPETKPNMVNVHLVPHSHNDVGWLKTVDQYYYSKVPYIIETVISALLENPKRRFIWVEISYFAKWWQEQPEEVRQSVRQLVHEGRLEFTGGGWSSNDEATVHYQSVIDQFTVGLKWLNETFGPCARPRVGWQIDAFGHSREQASIFAQMGYDGEFFARMDHKDQNNRLDKLAMEMIWDASESLDHMELFTGLLRHHYTDPPGFCFDIQCTDSPIIDGRSYDNNVEDRVHQFIVWLQVLEVNYRSDHLMVQMGGDFHYKNAQRNFKNMDKLIKYVNEYQFKYHVSYSTPACYLNALHQTLATWPNKSQDFFPYASGPNSFWTGYYTTRPTQKRFERVGNHMLQTAKQLSVFAGLLGEQQKENLEYLRQIMGVMQHHDAISGTTNQAVADDYDRMLHIGIVRGASNARDALRLLTNLPEGEFESCLQLNISECAFTKDTADNVVVTLFNPLAHTSSQYVRVPVKEDSYQVTDEKGRAVASEVVPVAWQVLELAYRQNNTQHELVFKASVNKIASYYIKKVNKPESKATLLPKRLKKKVSETMVQTSQIKLVIDNTTGRLKRVQMNGVSENIEQNFGVYYTKESCHYTFGEDEPLALLTEDVEFTVYDGSLVKEVHQQFNEWISQIIRIYEGSDRVEFEWLIGPIPDGRNREIVTLFDSGISSNGIFYTDSNGRELIRRERGRREDFTPELEKQPTSGNYYPVTSRICLEDKGKRLVILNDRSQGGTSMNDGQLELMLHRRTTSTNLFGIAESLDERQYGQGLVARGKLYLMLSSVARKNTFPERLAAKEIHLPFWKFFSSYRNVHGSAAIKSWPDFNVLPSSVHLLTLEPFTEHEILLRLEHFLDHTEGQSISFNIRPIFDSLGGVEIRETTLDGSLPLSEMKRMKFQHDGSESRDKTREYITSLHQPLLAHKSHSKSEFNVSLKPMQIRTFIIRFD